MTMTTRRKPRRDAAEELRHWVISPRSEEGSRAFALIETCCCRGASAWHYLGCVIAAARKGLQLPALPTIPAVG